MICESMTDFAAALPRHTALAGLDLGEKTIGVAVSDRMLSVAYGLVYDYIFEKFGPYQKLQAEVLELVEASAKELSPDRRALASTGEERC